MMVSCDKCNMELQSSQEKISHKCNWDSGSVLSGPPSISLLANRSPSPSPEVFKDAAMGNNSEASWADLHNTNKSLEEGDNVEEFEGEGEILEGHSEVGGPSGMQGNATPAST